MSRFKPGDLALIIGGKVTENIGKVVQVHAAVPPGRHEACGRMCSNESACLAWVCSGDRLVAESIDFYSRIRSKAQSRLVLVLDPCLMPINGDPSQQQDDESEPAQRSIGVRT